MFDYRDQHELDWSEDQAPALRRLTDVYLKPWFEPAWRYDLRMGLLPVRRYTRFSAALRLDRALSKLGMVDERRYDVAFVGRPNQTQFIHEGQIKRVEQRAQWIHDIKRLAPDLRFWGGLVGVNEGRRKALDSKFGSVDQLMHGQQKVRFSTYYRSLKQSRVVLAPGGNVPWTYRHYECLYSGAVVVTIDYRTRDMLTPLPRDSMIHVPDGAAVVPAVHEALDMYHKRPQLGTSNAAHLERFLRCGSYSKNRRALIDRFVKQLRED